VETICEAWSIWTSRGSAYHATIVSRALR
jgi:hypothetical protein